MSSNHFFLVLLSLSTLALYRVIAADSNVNTKSIAIVGHDKRLEATPGVKITNIEQSPVLFNIRPPSNCTASPDPLKANSGSLQPSHFSIKCAPGVTGLHIDFPANQSDGNIVVRGRTTSSILSTLDIRSDEHINDLFFCNKKRDSCRQFQMHVTFSSYEVPVIESIDVLGVPMEQPIFNPQADSYNVTVYANVLTTFVVRSNYRHHILVGGYNQTADQGFIESTFAFKYRATHEGTPEIVMLYAMSHDGSIARPYKLIIKALPSQEPRLASLSLSPGRLDPKFSPDIYSYFARVPPGRTSFTLHLEGLDSKNTICSMKNIPAGGNIRGQGDLTVFTASLPGGVTGTIQIDCVAEDETRTVHYTISLVPEIGGTTLLQSLEVLGGKLKETFDSQYHGPYTVDLDTHQGENVGWLSFKAYAKNPRAIILTDGLSFDPVSHQSPWFKVELGTKRYFSVSVSTPENPIGEVYTFQIYRHSNWSTSLSRARTLSSWLGTLSAIASADTAASFLRNIRYLQFISLTGRIHQTPETYEPFADGMNKWNLQFNAPGFAHMKNRLTDGVITSPVINSTSAAMLMLNMITPKTPSSELNQPLEKTELFLDASSRALDQATHDELLKDAVIITMEKLSSNFLKASNGQSNEWTSVLLKNEEDANQNKILKMVSQRVTDSLRGKLKNSLPYDMTSAERRRLVSLSDAEQLSILGHVNSAHIKEKAVIDYMTSIICITAILIIVAIIYFAALAWVVHVGIKDNRQQVRDMPVILHPVRFWAFVFDIVLMAYAQASFGILCCPSNLRLSKFIILQCITTTPLGTMWFAAIILLLFPFGYLSAVAWALFTIKKNVVFSNELSQYHRKNIYTAKAESKFLSWIPILSNLLAIEIRDIAPIFTPEDSFEDDEQGSRQQIEFIEDRTTSGPCLLDAPEYGLTSSTLLSNGKPEELQYQMLHNEGSGSTRIQYNSKTDELKVSLGGLRGSYMYDSSNTPVYDKYPDAILGRKPLKILSPYSYGLVCHVDVQLQHLSNLWQMSELPHHFHFWIPRRNCHMGELDGWSTLLALSQRGNYFYYIIDRVIYLTVVGAIVIGQETRGITTSWLIAFLCLLTAAAYTPSAISSGTSKWYALMAQECDTKKKDAAFEEYEKQRESKWPYTENSFFKNHVDQIQAKKEAMDPCGHGGWFSRHPYCGVDELSFWNYRLWSCAREIICGAPGLELIKFFILSFVAFGNTSANLMSNGTATNFAMFFGVIGSIMINYDSCYGLFFQCGTMVSTIYKAFRNLTFFIFDTVTDVPRIRERMAHLLTTCLRRCQGEMWVSYDYPAESGEVVRDFKVNRCSLVADEVGIRFSGVVEPDEITRHLAEKIGSLHTGRYSLYKTLYKASPIGAARDDLQENLPIRLPFRDFYLGAHAQPKGVAATIHIVNHGYRSVLPNSKAKNVFTADDDSYLTLYRDPRYMPEWGAVLSSSYGHGHVVHYDRQTKTLIFRGPDIKAHTRYHVRSLPGLSTEDDTLLDEDGSSEFDTGRVSSSTNEANCSETHHEARATCTIPGRLYVRVPSSRPPCLLEEIDIEPVNTSEARFHIDPQEIKVYYDKVCHELILCHRLFSSALGSNEYIVKWRIQGKEFRIQETAICEDRGVLYVPCNRAGIPDLKTMIALTDDEDKTILINPRETDAHRVFMPKNKELRGPNLVVAKILGAFTAFLKQISATRSPLGAIEEGVPCTVIQCVNPSLGQYRVEPNFSDVMAVLRAQAHFLEAQRTNLKTSQRIAWAAVMTQREVDLFWRSHGINTVPADGVWIDPLDSSEHPLMRSQTKKIESLVAVLRNKVDLLLTEHIKAKEAALKVIGQWVIAYNDLRLYSAQLDRDLIELSGTAEAFSSHIEKVRSFKASYEASIPNFFYPFVVDERMIAKMPNVPAQLRQWQRQLGVWLRTEEDALISSSGGDGLSPRSAASSNTSRGSQLFSLEKTLADIMRALKDNINREEDSNNGSYRTVLHYVLDSLSVRGPYTNWRPDPIGGHLALVRIWYPDANGDPDFSREPVWNPCCLKLSGTAIKILLPGKDDVEFRFRTPFYWSHVLGHAIQLDCLEALEVSRQYTLPVGHSSNAMLRGMPGQLICRLTSVLQHVGDKHIRLIESGASGKEILMKHDGGDDSSNNGNEGESFVVSLGRRVSINEAADFPASEVRIANDHAQTFPLTFRFAERFVNKWGAVVEAAQMDRPPLDIDLNFGLESEEQTEVEDYTIPTDHTRQTSPHSTKEAPSRATSGDSRNPPSSPSHGLEGTLTPLSPPPSASSSSQPSSARTPSSPSTPHIDYYAEYAGQWQGYQYHGKGALRDSLGEPVYAGHWKHGWRWGEGEFFMKDLNGRPWTYKGQFIRDDMEGEGELFLNDADERVRLAESRNPEDREQIVRIKAVFSPIQPSAKQYDENTSPLENGYPNIDVEVLRELFETDSNYDLSAKPLVIDVRRAMSAVESCSASADSATSSHPQTALREKYLPHRTRRWCSSVEQLKQRLTRGIAYFANGSVYEGELKDGIPSGRGIFMSVDGRFKCEGSFLKGKPHGYATVLDITEHGKESVYYGNFSNGLRHGHGVQTSENGKLYIEGEWTDDKLLDCNAAVIDVARTERAGQKELAGTSAFLRRYVGSLKDGLPHGEGKLVWKDNIVYKGAFAEGKRHGYGVMQEGTVGNKVLLSGSWTNDVPHGRVSRMLLPDGKVYTGEMQYGLRQGMGELFQSEKGEPLYEGLWKEDQPHGRGIFYCIEGQYDGEFRNGQRHGKGMFSFAGTSDPKAKKRSYVGDWRADVPHGIGMYANEAGVVNTYKFVRGVLDKTSVNVYKGGICGKIPNVGADPKMSPTAIGTARPNTFGTARQLLASEFKQFCGRDVEDGLWPRLIMSMKPVCVEFKDAPVRPVPIQRSVPLRRTTDEKVPAEAVAARRLVIVTVTEVDGCVMSENCNKAWISVSLDSDRQHVPTINPRNGLKWNVPLLFPISTESMAKLELWGAALGETKGELVAAGEFDMADYSKDVKETGLIQICCKSKDDDTLELKCGLRLVFFGTAPDPMRAARLTASASRFKTPDTEKRPKSAVSDGKQSKNVKLPYVHVTLNSAKDLPDMDIGKEMDPYVLVSMGEQRAKTKVCTRGGSNPTFDEKLVLPHTNEKELKIEIYDKDMLTKDDFIGGTTVDLTNGNFSGALSLSRPSKTGETVHAGTIDVSVELINA